MTTTFYVASSLSNREAALALVQRLQSELGWTCSYNWAEHGPKQGAPAKELTRVAHAEIRGVMDADWVFALMPGGRGTHAEFGIALACAELRRKNAHQILVIAPESDFDPNTRTCAFYFAPGVIRVHSIEQAFKYVEMIRNRNESDDLQ